MPRKRRTVNPDKALKMWVAPEWSTRLHESHSSTVMSSGFSRYVALADKVLAKEAKENAARFEAEARRERSDNAARQPMLDNSDGRAQSSDALLAVAAPKMTLPKPPNPPVYRKPPKVRVPKPRSTPVLAKPRRVTYPKPPALPR